MIFMFYLWRKKSHLNSGLGGSIFLHGHPVSCRLLNVEMYHGGSGRTITTGLTSAPMSPRDGPLRDASASPTPVKAQLGDAAVGAAEPAAKFAVDILHHDYIGVDVGLVVRVEVSGRQLIQHGCGLRDDGG